MTTGPHRGTSRIEDAHYFEVLARRKTAQNSQEHREYWLIRNLRASRSNLGQNLLRIEYGCVSGSGWNIEIDPSGILPLLGVCAAEKSEESN